MVAVSKAGIKVDGMAMEVEVEVEEEEILEGAFRMVDLDVAGVENLEEDLIVVEGVVMLLVFSVIIVNFLVDLTYAAVDPRLRQRS